MVTKLKVLNSKGEPIILNGFEQKAADRNQKIINELGYNLDITTLTQITKKVSEQKFFEVKPSLYLPVVVGEGAWSDQLLTYRSFEVADEFETGIINDSNSDGKLATADAAIDGSYIKNNTWGKKIAWSIPQLQEAARSGNWDLVTAKEVSRKRNWDLGIQRIAFLGARDNSRIKGLYNQSVVTPVTGLITKKISSMSSTELSAFLILVIGTYRTQCKFTAWPSHFILPETDYTGLAAPSDPGFPLKSKLELLEQTFKTMTKNPNFQILPCAYGDAVNNSLTVQRYILLNYDESSLKINVPVAYTNTLANSVDNFHFQNVGYGQFTGVQVLRELELMYMDYNN